MLIPFDRLLVARRADAAVGVFTTDDLEDAIGILRASRAAGGAVILLIGSASFAAEDGPSLLSALVSVAARAPDVRVCVQLDHRTDLGAIESAPAAGAGAVMADGYVLPYAENLVFVHHAVELARGCGVAVEAGPGTTSGDEHLAQAVVAGTLTDPRGAADFVARSGPRCLAVSIGSVHGSYRQPPKLDVARLQAICDRCSAPFSLHGASEVPDRMVAAAIGSRDREDQRQHRALRGVHRDHDRTRIRPVARRLARRSAHRADRRDAGCRCSKAQGVSGRG